MTSDNTPPRRTALALALVPVLVLAAGCETGPERIYAEAPTAHVPDKAATIYVYPPAPQVVTSDALEGILSRYRGLPLVICIWRAADPNVTPALHEAVEVQAQYTGSRTLGINLDSPDAWLSVAVPTLRAAQARFPVVARAPQSVTYVVLNAEGKRIATRTPFEPAGIVSPVSIVAPASTAKPIVAAPAASEPFAPATAAATEPLAEARPEDTLFYKLRVVRMADGVVVADVDGAGFARDVRLALEGQGGQTEPELANWLRMAGLKIASRLPPASKVAIAQVRCNSRSGELATDASSGLSFSQAVAAAVKASGRQVVGPSEVSQACETLGIAQELLERKPSNLRASLPADYLVIGAVSAASTGPSGQR
jgi:hypothetical protein